MSSLLERQVRLNNKVLDADQAARLALMRTDVAMSARGTAAVLVAEGLLGKDVMRMTGMPPGVVGALMRLHGRECEKPGSRPKCVKVLMKTPARHLRATVFLAAFDRARTCLGVRGTAGEAFAAAIRVTRLVAGHWRDDGVSAQVMVLAVEEWLEGRLYASRCRSCGTGYLRATHSLGQTQELARGGACPYCKVLKRLHAGG